MSESGAKRKLIRDISANTLQTGVTQFFGLVFFYITSRYLEKDDFGEFSWSTALGATIVAVLSLGLDLIFVKRLASGRDVVETSGIHLFHTLLTGFIICFCIWILGFITPVFFSQHPLVIMTLLYLSLSNIANSFKLCLNGLESYRKLAILAIVGNVFKFLMILILFLTNHFSVSNLILTYGVAAIVEFLVGYSMVRSRIQSNPKPLLRRPEYKYFILESLPQLGVVLFDSALARIDWILLGIIGTAASGITVAGMTAEYSFTYKVFEVSKLPLLVIAPILLTRFSKIFAKTDQLSDKHQHEIEMLFRFENFVLLFIPLFLISVWSPLIDYFTNGKYGQVNESKYWVLAACIPMHGIINFLWTSGFVQGQLKKIMYITIGASLINLIANVLLIPPMGGMGAALAFLFSTIVQLILYIFFTGTSALKVNFWPALLMTIFAFAAVFINTIVSIPVFWRPLLVFTIYFGLTTMSGAVNIRQSINILRGR